MKNILVLQFVTFLFITLFIGCNKNVNTDKTLVSWVEITDPNVSGGSILTIQLGDQFDGIVFGEIEKGKWIAGSDNWKRTQKDLSSVDPETEEDLGKLIQMAIVYEGNEIRIYRDGEIYTSYEADNIDLLNRDDNFVVFGIRHMGGNGYISAEIEDARIYSSALSVQELNSLKPDVLSDITPYAWWDFEGEEIIEKTGRYKVNMLLETEDGNLRDGRLVLRKYGGMTSFKEYVEETPVWPENLPEDWVTYHIAHPGPGIGEPGDPNPAYFYKGRYHLHYIYRNQYGFAYAHVSSKDMVHWKWHPTVLTPPITGHGMFSGTGFFTEDGTPGMIYHGQGSGRNMLAYALDDNLDNWTKPEPIEPVNKKGELPDMNHWDPDIWKIEDNYYALSGGKDPELLKSRDLKNWNYLGKLLHEEFPKYLGVTRDEDISCANMFKIGNKWMLLCISHQLGCRYFLGDFIDEKYLPNSHHMMNWVNTDWENGPKGLVYFAPESMLTEDGRRVLWTWIIGDIKPTAVQALPRELELPEDGILRIKPLRELEKLRYEEIKKNNISVTSKDRVILDDIKGDAIELKINFGSDLPEEFGLSLFDENLQIKYGSRKKSISIGSINPPFDLMEDEEFVLRIFIDKNLVEIFANDRQAAVVAGSKIQENPNIQLFTNDGDLLIKEIWSWKMKSIYKNSELHY